MSAFETGPTSTFTLQDRVDAISAAVPDDATALHVSPRRAPKALAAAVGIAAVVGIALAVVMQRDQETPAVAVLTTAPTNPPVAPPAEPAAINPSVPPSEPTPTPTPTPVPPPPTETVAKGAPAERELALKGPATVQWRFGGKLLTVAGGVALIPATAKTIVAIDTKSGARTPVPVPASGGIDYAKLPRGRLVVRANPWAEVSLAKTKLGQTPFAPVDVVAGSYTVTLAFEGRKEKQTIEVKPGAEARVVVDFTKKKP